MESSLTLLQIFYWTVGFRLFSSPVIGIATSRTPTRILSVVRSLNGQRLVSKFSGPCGPRTICLIRLPVGSAQSRGRTGVSRRHDVLPSTTDRNNALSACRAGEVGPIQELCKCNPLLTLVAFSCSELQVSSFVDHEHRFITPLDGEAHASLMFPRGPAVPDGIPA